MQRYMSELLRKGGYIIFVIYCIASRVLGGIVPYIIHPRIYLCVAARFGCLADWKCTFFTWTVFIECCQRRHVMSHKLAVYLYMNFSHYREQKRNERELDELHGYGFRGKGNNCGLSLLGGSRKPWICEILVAFLAADLRDIQEISISEVVSRLQ